MSEHFKAVVGDNSLDRICGLCNRRLGEHVIPEYGNPKGYLIGESGMLCPTDAQLARKHE